MNDKKIILAHGSGGLKMDHLIRDVFLKHFKSEGEFLPDSYIFKQDGNCHLAFTTDGFVVDPLFFPGGNIGMLAVSGTVNDLAVSGAQPLYLSSSFIIEEGFPISDLEQIAFSMAKEATKARVKIVTGDTKIVPRGKADKIFINTTGIGLVNSKHVHISRGSEIQSGDVIIINGNLGDHAVAVMSQRDNVTFETPVYSDVAPLNDLIQHILEKTDSVVFMRDVTRGGLASVTKEIVENKDFGITLFESKIPVATPVTSYCEIYGYDPLYLANEGKICIITRPGSANNILEIVKDHSSGKNACIIGEITNDHPGRVYLKTKFQGTRIIEKLSGEQLPRIC